MDEGANAKGRGLSLRYPCCSGEAVPSDNSWFSQFPFACPLRPDWGYLSLGMARVDLDVVPPFVDSAKGRHGLPQGQKPARVGDLTVDIGRLQVPATSRVEPRSSCKRSDQERQGGRCWTDHRHRATVDNERVLPIPNGWPNIHIYLFQRLRIR